MKSFFVFVLTDRQTDTRTTKNNLLCTAKAGGGRLIILGLVYIVPQGWTNYH